MYSRVLLEDDKIKGKIALDGCFPQGYVDQPPTIAVRILKDPITTMHYWRSGAVNKFCYEDW
jgi:hypothetical protein